MTGTPAGDAGPAGTPGPTARATWHQEDEPALRAALAPVRAALLRRAREQASEITAQARRQAEDALARARRDAASEVARAREAGRSQVGPLAAELRTQSHRRVQATVLSAQREAYEELCGRVRASVASLRDEPGYDLLLERLRQDARRAAGPGATLTEAPAGGVIARAPGMVVDCSLPRLAGAAVEALGDRVAWLWTPGRRGGRS